MVELRSAEQSGARGDGRVLIARVLDVADEPRIEWVSWDLRISSGVTVEVKSAAYAQAWPQQRLSDIRFDVALRKQVWEPGANEFRDLPGPHRSAVAHQSTTCRDIVGRS